MASERSLKTTASASIAAMLALCGGAGYFFALASPRLSVLCLLLAMPPAWLLCRCLNRLAPRVSRQESAMTAAMAAAPPTPDEESLRALEACLEHAPIALFRIQGGAVEHKVTPLNASARRQLAPGHASEPQRWQQLLAAQPPGQRRLLSFDTERGVERALVAVAALPLQGAPQHLAALMPVESELEAEALNAWRVLVQVLTHEIMNSLTPVASLSRTACDLLADVRPLLPHDIHADLATALDAIARRAASLADFVASAQECFGVGKLQGLHLQEGFDLCGHGGQHGFEVNRQQAEGFDAGGAHVLQARVHVFLLGQPHQRACHLAHLRWPTRERINGVGGNGLN